MLQWRCEAKRPVLSPLRRLPVARSPEGAALASGQKFLRLAEELVATGLSGHSKAGPGGAPRSGLCSEFTDDVPRAILLLIWPRAILRLHNARLALSSDPEAHDAVN